MSIKELKKHLLKIIENLERYDEDESVDVASNTYFLNKKYICTNMLEISGVGFINLDDPVNNGEEEEF